MISKTGNNSISDELIYNNKPNMENFNIETSLVNQNKFRRVRDLATDSVVNSLFSYDYRNPIYNQKNSTNRNLFLLFVFDYFNLHIVSDFENYLISNNCDLINNDLEYIKFLFKGGNMFFYKIIELIEVNNIYNGLNNNQQNIMKDFFSDNFSVSDFDFTVIIKCITHEKYIKTKYYLTKFLINKLEDITLFFNSYLHNCLSNINPYFNNNDNTLSYNGTPIAINDPILINHDLIPRLHTYNDDLIINNDRVLIKLELINNMFNSIYNNNLFDKLLSAIKNNNELNYNIDAILVGHLNNNLLNYYSNIISLFEQTKIIIEIRDIIIHIRLINDLLSNDFNGLNPVNNKYYNANIIKVISKLEYINNKYSNRFFIYPPININIFKNAQNTYFNTLKNNFRDINFYCPESFGKIIDNLMNSINRNIIQAEVQVPPQNLIYVKDIKQQFLFKNKNDYNDDTNYEIVKLTMNNNERIANQDIVINTKDNILFYTDNFNKMLYTNNDIPNNYHYISYNSSINSTNYYQNINFDLLRTKLNLELKHAYIKKYLPDIPQNWRPTNIKIPSEFIDISIPEYNETGYNHIISTRMFDNFQVWYFKIPVQRFINNTFEIESFTISYYIHDLLNVLFVQNTMVPLLDAKYFKRLRRLFFLFVIDNHRVNFPFLIILCRIANNMLDYLDPNNVNPMNNLNYINFFSRYNVGNNDFIDLVRNNHKNANINFCIDDMYNYHLDELINTLFFLFYIQCYYRNPVNRPILLELINYLRNKVKYYSFNDVELNNNYINNIVRFITNVRDESQRVINIIITIWAQL